MTRHHCSKRLPFLPSAELALPQTFTPVVSFSTLRSIPSVFLSTIFSRTHSLHP